MAIARLERRKIMVQSLAQAMGKFVQQLRVDNLPPHVVEKARACLLNAYCVGLVGARAPSLSTPRNAVLAAYGEQEAGATILGDGRKTAIAGAVVANSALFHARTQEDSLGAAHFGTILVPLLTALCEAKNIATTEIIPALVAGYEIGGLLENKYAGKTTPVGIRASALYGPIAGAAAASRLFGLDADRTAAAIAMASASCGGTLQCWADGSDEWRYQVGMAAANGYIATELARAGHVYAPFALEGQTGLIRAFARDQEDAGRLAETLGKEWMIEQVTFKPFPVCVFNQTPVLAALQVSKQGIDVAGIDNIVVRVNPYVYGYSGMNTHGPFDTFAGMLMSTPTCVSIALIHGEPDVHHLCNFTDERVNALMKKVRVIPDPSLSLHSAGVEVRLKNGSAKSDVQELEASDFSYGRDQLLSYLRRFGERQNIPDRSFDIVSSFVQGLPNGKITSVLSAFDLVSDEAKRI
jgi:2-methylcitrate dehydratase PrpD